MIEGVIRRVGRVNMSQVPMGSREYGGSDTGAAAGHVRIDNTKLQKQLHLFQKMVCACPRTTCLFTRLDRV